MGTMEHQPRIAAIYDIHGNRTALEAVLAEIDALGIQRIVVGGDIAWGTEPRACVDRVMRLGIRAKFVRGNADREVADGHDNLAAVPPEIAQITAWCAKQLNAAQRVFLGTLPEFQRLTVSGLGPVFFCHGSPRSDEEAISEWMREGEVEAMVRPVRERTIVCGHTHVHFDRQVAGKRIINAGSVGLHHDSGACWAILGPDVEFRRTPYDVDLAVARVAASGVPGDEEFIYHLRNPDPGQHG
ncbi:MAG TPA: metallophosphoesterase family protein [Thermomicrobiales bacterium]|nr:metallophosphoesterase family protein [Thermomicrobiales bacterium]